MNSLFKKPAYLVAMIVVFTAAYIISTQRLNSHSLTEDTNHQITASNQAVLDVDTDTQITQNVLQDFEDSFLKQYTPLVGCEDIYSETNSNECNIHLENSKNEFKQEYIQRRGLPIDAFATIQLSATH